MSLYFECTNYTIIRSYYLLDVFSKCAVLAYSILKTIHYRIKGPVNCKCPLTLDSLDGVQIKPFYLRPFYIHSLYFKTKQ